MVNLHPVVYSACLLNRNIVESPKIVCKCYRYQSICRLPSHEEAVTNSSSNKCIRLVSIISNYRMVRQCTNGLAKDQFSIFQNNPTGYH